MKTEEPTYRGIWTRGADAIPLTTEDERFETIDTLERLAVARLKEKGKWLHAANTDDANFNPNNFFCHGDLELRNCSRVVETGEVHLLIEDGDPVGVARDSQAVEAWLLSRPGDRQRHCKALPMLETLYPIPDSEPWIESHI